jgi:hypothetical protein
VDILFSRILTRQSIQGMSSKTSTEQTINPMIYDSDYVKDFFRDRGRVLNIGVSKSLPKSFWILSYSYSGKQLSLDNIL